MLDVQQHIKTFHETVSEGGNRFTNGLREHLVDPLLDAVDEISKSVHVLEGIDLMAPTGVSRDDVAAVTKALQHEFLPAYGKLLSSSNGLTVLADGFKTWSADIESACEDLPEVVTRAEPEALYAASSADSTVQASRKALVRTRRKVMEKDASHSQDIPLRMIGQAYSRVWLPVQFGKVIDDDRRRMAQALSTIEKHVSMVFHLGMQAEYRIALRDLSDGASTEEKPPGPILESFSKALQTLKKVLEETPAQLRPVALESARERMERAWIPFETQIELSDSFLSSIPTSSTEDLATRLKQLAGNGEAWNEWLKRLKERHAYLSELVSLRAHIEELAETQSRALNHRIRDRIGEAVRTTSTHLDDISSRTQSLFSGPGNSLFNASDDELKKLSDAGTETITTNLVVPFQEIGPVSCLNEEAEHLLEGLAGLREKLRPDYRMHPLQNEAKDRINPDADARLLNLREMAHKASEDVTEDRLESRTESSRDGLRELVEEAGELPSILSFSFQSIAESGGGSEAEKAEDNDSGADIALGGIRRTIEAMSALEKKAAEEVEAASKAMHLEVLRAWGRLHERVRVEHQVGGYVLDVKSKLDSEARQVGRQVARQLREVKVLAERFLRRGQRQAKDLIEKGKEAVGSPTVTRASFHETAVGLSELEAVLNSVPPVYRKLFSFQPLTDPELLIGRSEGITFIQNQLEQFDMGTPQAAVLVGGPSSGRTSLLNVVRGTLLADRDVRTLQLNQKIHSASDIMELFRSDLALPLPSDCQLDDAADLILAQPDDGAKPPICIVEHLEALMLRGIGGYGLLGDVLKFMSRTDTRIIWISTVSSFGWQLMSTSDGVAAALVNRYSMKELGRAELERLIMERHKKSGVPIDFVQPEELNPLLRRRLNRTRSKEMKQELLKEAFFDRLFSQFGQNIQMALLQWVRSVEMEGDSGRMQVRVTQPLNLSFFTGFQLDQVFALKALLEHGHLSIEEYAAIDRITLSRSMSVFETLGNALVIEAVESDDRSTLFRHVAVRSGVSYRIRPLFTHAAIRLLKERNVVH